MTNKTLSKSEFISFLRHPALLWYKKHDKSKLPETDPSLQTLFDLGNLFEEYAEQLYGDAIKLGFNNYDEYIALPLKTESAIRSGYTQILQGRFEANSNTCISDVLQIQSDGSVKLTEIKASTTPKVDHEYDLAFQAKVLMDGGYKVETFSVVHVNNSYVRQGEIEIGKLCIESDITENVRTRIDEVDYLVSEAHAVMSRSEPPELDPSLSRLGSTKEWIELVKEIEGYEDGSIFDLCQLNKEDAINLRIQGIQRITDIPQDFILKPKQAIQVESAKSGKPVIRKPKIKTFLEELQFPLYFIDYETMMDVVPCFDGMQPYKQYPFQYSLHVLRDPESEPEHYEYLHTQNSDPTTSVCESLRNHIGTEGTILTWNMSFEKTCNSQMAKMNPSAKVFLNDFNSRTNDLMIPFSRGWYVDAAFKGSASIKKVLPVLIPELSFKDLELQNGNDAQKIWMDSVLRGIEVADLQNVFTNLRDYCGLDTFAMVKIYKKLYEVAGV